MCFNILIDRNLLTGNTEDMTRNREFLDSANKRKVGQQYFV